MIDYDSMSDQKINIEVAKIKSRGRLKAIEHISDFVQRGFYDYCKSPGLWGELMQDNEISCGWFPDEEGGTDDSWSASTGKRYENGDHPTSPGRAVSICYLRMMDRK